MGKIHKSPPRSPAGTIGRILVRACEWSILPCRTGLASDVVTCCCNFCKLFCSGWGRSGFAACAKRCVSREKLSIERGRRGIGIQERRPGEKKNERTKGRIGYRLVADMPESFNATTAHEFVPHPPCVFNILPSATFTNLRTCVPCTWLQGSLAKRPSLRAAG